MKTPPKCWWHLFLHWPERIDSRIVVRSWSRIKLGRCQCPPPGERGSQTTSQHVYPWRRRESRRFFPRCRWTALGPSANTACKSWGRLVWNSIRRRSLKEKGVLASFTVWIGRTELGKEGWQTAETWVSETERLLGWERLWAEWVVVVGLLGPWG